MMRYETSNVNMKTTCKRRDHGFSRHCIKRYKHIGELPKNCYANRFSAKIYNFNPF